MLQTATSGVKVGTTMASEIPGAVVLQAFPAVAARASGQACTFTRAGTGVVIAAAVAAVFLRHAQLSQVALR